MRGAGHQGQSLITNSSLPFTPGTSPKAQYSTPTEQMVGDRSIIKSPQGSLILFFPSAFMGSVVGWLNFSVPSFISLLKMTGKDHWVFSCWVGGSGHPQPSAAQIIHGGISGDSSHLAAWLITGFGTFQFLVHSDSQIFEVSCRKHTANTN